MEEGNSARAVERGGKMEEWSRACAVERDGTRDSNGERCERRLRATGTMSLHSSVSRAVGSSLKLSQTQPPCPPSKCPALLALEPNLLGQAEFKVLEQKAKFS